jgi:hypothetical protein
MTKAITDKRVAEAVKTERPDFQPGIYRHWKGGLYRALFLARDSVSQDKSRLLVVYISMTNGEMFARPLYNEESSWSDDVLLEHENNTASWVPRFSFVESAQQGPTLTMEEVPTQRTGEGPAKEVS